MADNAQFPLRGVIMCCTSIPPEQRSDLAATAEQMGAIHKFDLTSDVTHLIVGDTDTPKYKFVAKERFDVKVLLPDWLAAVRTSWLEGGATDVATLEEKHRLPTFYGLRICVTGFEDLTLRKQLEDEVKLNGGEYRGNLTKDVTHLIAKEPTGQKYNYAKQWEIKTVSVEWHEQSLERGMILDENLYNPLLPASDRGRGAWIQRSISTTSLGKRAREGDAGPQNARKLRRTTSAKFETQNDNLWTDIVSAEVKTGVAKVDDWDEQPPTKYDHRLSALSGSQTIEQDSVHGKGRTALEKTQSFGSLDSLLARPAQPEGFFRDSSFSIQGFDGRKLTILETHLRSHGAIIIDGSSELPLDDAYFLVPHTMPISEVEGLVGTEHLPRAVTDLWIERCLYCKRRERPLEHVVSTPYYEVKLFPGLIVNSTGFEGIARSQLAKVVHLLGATYEETFAEETFARTGSVLICNATSPDHPKLQHAQLWEVPAVSPDWLWESVRRRKSLPFDRYLIQAVSPPNLPAKEETLSAHMAKDPRAERPVTRPATAEKVTMKASKGKAITSEHQIGSNRGYKKLSSFERTNKSSANIFPDDTGPQLEPAHVQKDAEIGASDCLGRSILTNNGQHSPGKPASPTRGAGQTKSMLSPHGLRKQYPLQEVSPNSSPPKPPSSNTDAIKAPPSPADNLKTSKTAYDDETLGSAISSLLSHHQKQRSSNTTKPTTEQSSDPTTSQPYRRRRRTLLGRAPSNISSHSHNMQQLSRASSIDTLNTDGVGTPISLSDFKAPDGGSTSDRLKAIYDDSHEDPDKPRDEDLRMTQLGYEDPNVAAWRERVAIKMGGGKVKGSVTPGRVKNVAAGDREPAGGAGGLGISRRTRAAAGGR